MGGVPVSAVENSNGLIVVVVIVRGGGNGTIEADEADFVVHLDSVISLMLADFSLLKFLKQVELTLRSGRDDMVL